LKKDPQRRIAYLDDEERDAYYAFRELLWAIVDGKVKISIVEATKLVGWR
jgi:hypothetical protein